MKKSFFYYIEYIEKSSWSGLEKYPDIELKRVRSHTDATKIVESIYNDYLSSSFNNYPQDVEPILITNDLRLSLKYRKVFNEHEFKNWCCLEVDKKMSRQYFSKQNNIYGEEGQQVFNHFLKIKNDECDIAKMNKHLETIDDTETGGSIGDWLRNDGWVVSLNKNLKENSVDNNESDLDLFKWWAELDETWKYVFKKIIGSGFYLGIPSEETIFKILNLEKLNLSNFELHIKELNVEPLKKLKKLAKLNCYNIKLNNIESLKDNSQLEEISLKSMGITDLFFFKDFINLKKLDIQSNNLTSLKGLEKLYNLNFLNCSSNNITNLWPLLELKKLVELNCSYNDIENLIPLKQIKEISIIGNNISREEIDDFVDYSKISWSQIKR